MEFRELLTAAHKTAGTLLDGWAAKTALSATATLFGVSKGASWSRSLCWYGPGDHHLVDGGQGPDSVNLYACLVNIPAALRAGYINSSAMKHRFAGKLLIYCLLTIMAVNVDRLVLAAGEAQVMLRMTWVYLAATEAMSILENLREAGVEEAGGLLDFVRGRLSVLIDRTKNK